MSDSQYKDSVALYVEEHRVGEVAEHTTTRSILAQLPLRGCLTQRVDGLKYLGTERIRGLRVPLKIPRERRSNLCLGVRQDEDLELAHRDASRALASAQ
jgi:hypothetical protein